MNDDPVLDPATPPILNALFLVSGMSLHASPPRSDGSTAAAPSGGRDDPLRYNWSVARFCWHQAGVYLDCLEDLEWHKHHQRCAALRAATASLMEKAHRHLTSASQIVAQSHAQLCVKLHVVKHLLDKPWDDLDQFWPGAVCSLMSDLDLWVENTGVDRFTKEKGSKNAAERIGRSAKQCHRHIRGHVRLTGRLLEEANGSADPNDELIVRELEVITELRASIEGLSQLASMSFRETWVKAGVFRALMHPELAAYDTPKLDLAKSYCDDIWWLLLQSRSSKTTVC